MIRKFLTILVIVLKAAAAYLIRPDFRNSIQYARYLKKKALLPGTVLYESREGAAMSCNPYAIFRYLYEHDETGQFTHVWVFNGPKRLIAAEFRGKDNILFIRRNTRAYIKWLAQANYLVSNSTFPAFFQKKPGQVYLNTWHGTPLKHMGVRIPEHYKDRKNVLRNFLHADYLLSSCPHMTREMYLRSYQLEGFFRGAIIEEGLPRIDLTLRPPRQEFMKILKGLGYETGKKVILYAPTWKESGKKEQAETLISDAKELEKGINPAEYTLLIKAHSFLYAAVRKEAGLSGRLVPDTVDANELLRVTDILITDYSSIFFDFLVTGKPLLFYMPDAEKYRQTRGMYFQPEELPGKICGSVEALVQSIRDIEKTHAESRLKYNGMKANFCMHEDGQAARRIADIVFFGNTGDYNIIRSENKKKKILVYPGNMKCNGITASFLSLLNTVDYESYDITVYANYLKRAECIENVKKIHPSARLLYKPGKVNATFTEYCQRKYFCFQGSRDAPEKPDFPRELYEREWTRTFGDRAFDCVIDFCGYDYPENMLLSRGKSGNKIVYQHSDMFDEINGRFKKNPWLKSLLWNYRYFDKIAAVSGDLLIENKKKLYNYAPGEKYVSVRNSIDYKKILECAEDLKTCVRDGTEYIVAAGLSESGEKFEQLVEAPRKGECSFINIGRLSPEKNQMRLLAAFSKVYKSNSACRLYIVGGGALAGELTAAAESLGVIKAVVFTGQIDNPFSLLKKCDCFVLSSDYEGQGLVLLEALVLGVPVIATDVTGARGVCAEGYGKLVEKSEEGLAGGMTDFMNGKIKTRQFDYMAYNNAALNDFYKLLET